MPLRSFLAAVAVSLLLVCATSPATAQQIYKWKDANGVIHFSQSPPAHGAQYQKVTLSGAPEVSSNPPPASASTADAATPATPAVASASKPDTPANRANLCTQLRSNIALLGSKQPLVLASNQGKQQLMSDDAREQQLATARAQQKQYCSQP